LTTWQFSKSTQRYRDTRSGKFLSAEKLTQLIRTNNSQLAQSLDALNTLIIDDKITVSEWQSQAAEVLKRLHIQNYLLGRGGKQALTQRDYGLIGQKVQGQYRYLQGLSNDLLLGKMTEKQFRSRTQLYVNAANGTYELGRFEGFKSAGFKWEKRTRHALESCQECLAFSQMNWQPLGTLPNPGVNCQCKSNCKCRKEYAKEQPKQFVSRIGRTLMG